MSFDHLTENYASEFIESSSYPARVSSHRSVEEAARLVHHGWVWNSSSQGYWICDGDPLFRRSEY